VRAGLSLRATRWLGCVSDLPSAARQRVCLRLALRYSTAAGYITVSPGAVAVALGLHPRVLRRHLDELVDKDGLLDRVQSARRGRPAVYAMRIKGDAPEPATADYHGPQSEVDYGP
jgi:hypothetical protein